MKIVPFNEFTNNTQQNRIVEEEEYQFNPSEAADRLKRREEQNIQRYRDAQDRGDNYAIKKYELRIKLDNIDKKKIEIQTELHKLMKKFDKL